MDAPDKQPAQRIYVFLNGPLNPPPDLGPSPPEGAGVVAVDGGAVHCLALGWPIDLLMGDFDSLPGEVLERLKTLQPRLDIRPYLRDKDETDFELALDLLALHAPDAALIVLGGLGGRWDMTMANLLLPLAFDRAHGKASSAKSVVFRDGAWDLHVLSGPARLEIPASGSARRVSLIPMGARVSGATLEGPFMYPLFDDSLLPGRTRGLSNELAPEGGVVSIKGGILLVSVSPVDDEGLGPPGREP